MHAPIDEIKQFVNRNQYEMLLFWEALVNMQGSGTDIAQINRIMEFLKKHFEAEGFSCRLIDSKGGPDVLVAEYGKNFPGKPLILAGHCDTVFSDGDYPPDPFYIKDGIAYGPGVVDMKMGIMQAFYVMIALKQFGFKDRPVKVIFVGNEEISHIGSIVDKIVMDEAKGALCCFNMETGRMDNCLTVGRKGGVDCHIIVRGKSGHAGNEYTIGRNAIVEMAYKIPLLQNLSKVDEGLTVSVGVIKGGTVSNAIPDYCYVELDIRYSQVKHMEYIKEEIRKIGEMTFIEGTTTEIQFVSSMPAFEETQANHELLAHINKCAVACGYPVFGSIYVGGMSDAAYFGLMGVPTVCSMGGQGSGAHTREEKCIVQSVFDRTVIAIASAMEIDDYAQKQI
ncbi:MAG: M20/M25/M40 family metallo-hydrolase [Phascolarctobacterium sp.]|nr:M20/M25/M40 family metallo-hydrolase [Phascolarctobacterium sp.]